MTRDSEPHRNALSTAGRQQYCRRTDATPSVTAGTRRSAAALILSIVGACVIASSVACSRAGTPALAPDDAPHSEGWRYNRHLGGVYTTEDLERFKQTLPPVDNIEPVYQTDQ